MGVNINVVTGYGFIVKNTGSSLDELKFAKSFNLDFNDLNDFDGLSNMFTEHFHYSINVLSDCYDDTKDWFVCINCTNIMAVPYHGTGASGLYDTPNLGPINLSPTGEICIEKLHDFFLTVLPREKVSKIDTYSYLYFC